MTADAAGHTPCFIGQPPGGLDTVLSIANIDGSGTDKLNDEQL